jgi:NADH dehydrogenase
MSHDCITLIGGSGFVGTELVVRLAERFGEVRVLTRRARRRAEFRVLPNVRMVEVDVHDPKALAGAVAGSDVVINLVGILNEAGSSSKGSFGGAHESLTETVLAACQQNGVQRYLHMSSLNADAQNGSSEYLRSKGRAEAHVRALKAGLAWTIYQPSIIFGKRDAFFNRFAGLLRSVPWVFPLAVPEARMAPVWIGDVCRVMIDSIDDSGTHGSTLHLCGPEDFSLRELVEYTARTAGLKRRIIGLPDWAARLQAAVLGRVPGKPFSHDNYLSLKTDSVCDADCPRQPTSLNAIVPRYLGGEDWTGQLQDRRELAGR